MAQESQENLPVISENGEVRFPSIQSLREALPKLRNGSLTVHGNGPPRGSHTFRLLCPEGGIDERLRGDVMASVAGRSVLLLPELLPEFIARLDAVAGTPAPPAAGKPKRPPPPPPPPSPASPSQAGASRTADAWKDDAMAQMARMLSGSGDMVRGGVEMPKGSLGGFDEEDGATVVEATPLAALKAASGKDGDARSSGATVLPPATLDTAGVIPLFLKIAHHGLTGCLEVKRGNVVKIVAFYGGRPLEIRSNDPRERVGEVLVAQHRINRQQLTRALEVSQRDGSFFGAVLVKEGILSEAQLKESLLVQSLARLAELLTWTDGLARFDPNAAIDRSAATIQRSVLELFRELVSTTARFSADRALQWLGPNSKIAPADPTAWLMGNTQLNALELSLLKQCTEQSHTVHSLVAKQQSQGVNPADAVLAVFMLAAAGCVKLARGAQPVGAMGGVDPKAPTAVTVAAPSKDYDELKTRLEHGNLFTALGVNPSLPPEKLLERVDAIKAAVDKMTAGKPQAAKLREPLHRRLDEMRKLIKDPLEKAIQARAHAMGVDASDPANRELLEKECLTKLLGEGIAKGKFKDVLPMAKRALELSPKDPVAMAQNGLVRSLGEPSVDARKEAMSELLNAASNDLSSLELQLAAARACMETGQKAQAKSILAVAETIAGKDSRVVALRSALMGGAAAKGKPGPRPSPKGRAVQDGDALDEEPAGQPQPEEDNGTIADWGQIGQILAVVGVVCLVLYGLGVIGKFGMKEYFYTGRDGFWFFRRGLLVVAAFVGLAMIKKESPMEFFKNVGYSATGPQLIIAVFFGALSGYLSIVFGAQTVTGSTGVVLTLVVVHVLCEQIFFTGFVTRTLLVTIDSKVAVFFSGLFFGVYHITYYSISKQVPPAFVPFFLALVTLGAGLPYAIFYSTTRSIIPPLFCHMIVNVVAMLYSIGMKDLPPQLLE